MLKKILLCTLLLLSGIAGMLAMASFKTPLSQRTDPVPARLSVSVIQVHPEDAAPVITGYGRVYTVQTVDLSPRVSGLITHINPRLEPGETLSKGELLFLLDEKDYKQPVTELSSEAQRLESRLEQIRAGHAVNQKRYELARRNLDISHGRYNRLKALHEKKVSAKSTLDEAADQLNTAKDNAARLSWMVEEFPFTLKQVRAQLEQVNARLAAAQDDLNHCRMVAPFDCRIKHVDAEKGQYVTKGRPILSLADDSILEVQISLDSRDARKWLRFTSHDPENRYPWFSSLEPVTCQVFWADDDQVPPWQGLLHRVIRYDPDMHTLVLAIRIDARREKGAHRQFPLVEGMFCRALIPGRTVEHVYRLPRSSVTAEPSIRLACNNRLKTIPVETLWVLKEDAFITGALVPGDQVIVDPLIHPVEHTPLTIIPLTKE